MVKIIQDVDIMGELGSYDVTLIPAHINNSLSNGVQRDIALNYPHVQKANYATKYGDPKKMGTILECKEENEPTIVLVYIFKFYPHKKTKGEIIDFCSYESLEKCLQLVNARYKGQRVCSPLLGCSRFDGNGDREKVISLIQYIIRALSLFSSSFKTLLLRAISSINLKLKSRSYIKE